jgi:chromosome partitioning protein
MIFSICNQKGGVGKTTTTINLAAYLASAGKRVLVVDTDPQANTTSGLGINKIDQYKSVYDLLIKNTSPAEVIQETEVKNLFIIPSHINLTGFDVELVAIERSQFILSEHLSTVKNDFDFVLIDTPPSLGLLTVNALTASRFVLIPLQCEYYALEGLTQLLKTIELIKNSTNQNLQLDGIVLTMADFRTKLTQEVIDEIKKFFPDKMYKAIIPRSVKISEAPGYGKPVITYAAQSSGAVKYKEFAEEFLTRHSSHDDPVSYVFEETKISTQK